tara:strand:+ start:383 stop:1402 length:1020 start_codon:yes stop_codon:yes gene_type:complete
MPYILLTGGCGYIGSHTCVELIQEGKNIIIIDNLYNSNIKVIDRIKKITGICNDDRLLYYNIDMTNYDDLYTVFNKHNIIAIIHFAGLKAVAESIIDPIKYYDINIKSTLNLLKLCYNRCNIIFSSSATVYGNKVTSPIDETMPIGNNITNPYGMTKSIIEQILQDACKANNKFAVISLRYFNPIGAHPSSLIGEDPKGIPNNLMPILLKKVINNEQLHVYGNDYDTIDGSCVRDFIHVVDLAQAHCKALDKLLLTTGYHAYNVGTGNGISVLQLIDIFSKVCKYNVKYTICDKRAGDSAITYCNPTLIKQELNWTSKLTIADMCIDSWNWITNNPNGY